MNRIIRGLKNSLQLKLTLLILVIALIPAMAIGYVSQNDTQEGIEGEIYTALQMYTACPG